MLARLATPGDSSSANEAPSLPTAKTLIEHADAHPTGDEMFKADSLSKRLSGTGKIPELPSITSPPPPSIAPSTLQNPVIYFRAAELSTPPTLVTPPDIRWNDLPNGSSTKGGSVVLRIFINARGDVDQVTPLDNTLPSEIRELIADSFRHLLFKPGMLAEKAVPSQVDYEIDIGTSSTTRSRSTDSRNISNAEGRLHDKEGTESR